MRKCGSCELLLDPPPTPHAVVERCEDCGAKAYRGPGPDGIRVEKGETLTFPAGSITMSLDPSAATGVLTRHGVRWFVEKLITDPPKDSEAPISETLALLMEEAEAFLRASDMLSGFDLGDDAQAEAAFQRASEAPASAEFAAFAALILAQSYGADDYEGSREVALWNASMYRTIFLIRRNLHDLIWRGYSTVGVDQLRAALAAWEARPTDAGEEFWQSLIEANPILINLITIGPVVVEQNKAYVGGKSIDNRGGSVVDFLIKNSIGGNAGLLEIKTPETPLVRKAEYRDGVHAPSTEISGALVQVTSYRDTLIKNFHTLSGVPTFQAFNPTALILAGDYESLGTEDERRSFELFRSGLVGVAIVTYDELFKRVRNLLDTLAPHP